MSNIRDLITALETIEASPKVGDGFMLEFSDKILVETEISEITANGDIILFGDDKMMELLGIVEEGFAGRAAGTMLGRSAGMALGPAGAIAGSIAGGYVGDKVGDKVGSNIADKFRFRKDRDAPVKEEWETLIPGERFGLANPRIMDVGDDPRGMYDFKVVGKNVLSVYPFNANQWNNEQAQARNKGYMLRYVGKDPEKAKAADWHGDAPKTKGVDEAEYHGRKVPLGKPMHGDVKKSKVFVKDPSTGNVKKVNFGDKHMSIKKHLPGHRKSFRARHHCENPGPRTKARYWSCRAW